MENGEGKEFLPGYPTIDQFTQTNLKRILGVTKISNDLPGEKREDYDFYSTFPEFRKTMSSQGKKLKEMIKVQLGFQGIRTSVPTSEIEALVELLTDANDTILERINISLDEAAGIKRDIDPTLLAISEKNISKVAGSWNNFDRRKKNEETTEVKLLAAKNVLRPQMKFKKFIDNTGAPFCPRLTEKPHSKKPLSVLVEYDDTNTEYFSHPYLFEIERMVPEGEMLTASEVSMPKSVDSTELVYVQNSKELSNMIKELKTEPVIGVDLEGHTYRSYQGITCLLQLSTLTKDYLVDPFNIWEEMTQLNEIFANPNIVKVLHGCQQDVLWLQRDFSVYLVNVFDTHQAGKILGFPRLSLAWLLEKYCKVYADKQYQLADWRIRPLPEVMVYYARQDTRYLIYIYHLLKKELLDKGNEQKNLLVSAYQQSNMVCSSRYNKPVCNPDSHENLLKKTKAVYNNRQLFALQELFSWRDAKARMEDESTAYILPNHMMLKIASELPREMQGILACCNPIPPLVKQNLTELHMIILKARNKALLTVDTDLMLNPQQDNATDTAQMDYNDNPLKCPLDLSNMMDYGSGLTTLINTKTDKPSTKWQSSVNKNLLKTTPDLGIFAKKPIKSASKQKHSFVSPFERYRLLVPYLEQLKVTDTPQPAKQDDATTAENENATAAPSDNKEDNHLESIKKHFQHLTDMTPRPKKVVESASEGSEDEDGVEILDEPVKPKQKGGKRKLEGEEIKEEGGGGNSSVWAERQEIAKKNKKLQAEIDKEVEKRKLAIENKLVQEEITKKKSKKRKSEQLGDDDTPSKIPKEKFEDLGQGAGVESGSEEEVDEAFDYSKVDFNSMFAVEKPDASKDFNPGQKWEKKNQKLIVSKRFRNRKK